MKKRRDEKSFASGLMSTRIREGDKGAYVYA